MTTLQVQVAQIYLEADGNIIVLLRSPPTIQETPQMDPPQELQILTRPKNDEEKIAQNIAQAMRQVKPIMRELMQQPIPNIPIGSPWMEGPLEGPLRMKIRFYPQEWDQVAAVLIVGRTITLQLNVIP